MATAKLIEEEEEKTHRAMTTDIDLWADETEVQNRDPRYYYHLARAHPRRLGYWKRNGYEIVPWDAKEQLVGAIKGDDGGQQLGANILMRTPLENAQRRLKRVKMKQDFREGALDNTLRESLNKLARDVGRGPANKDIYIDKA